MKILRAADALYARQSEGPYRFMQNRSRASAVALKSDATAEKSKDQLSRDFPGRSIFDFCNNISWKRSFGYQRQTIGLIELLEVFAPVAFAIRKLEDVHADDVT